MNFPKPLTRATFVAREKRFLIHATLDNGQAVIAHTNNTGRMTGLLDVGAEIWLSPADNPARKLKWTLEIVVTGTPTPVLAGVNTTKANSLVAEAMARGVIPALANFDVVEPEVRYGNRNSRIDFRIRRSETGDLAWVEVKNATLVENGHARFPDAPTERGRKHLLELQDMVAQGDRAVVVFCCQRADAKSVGPADDIDPAYGHLLRQAVVHGVEVYGVRMCVRPQSIDPDCALPVILD